MNVGEWVCVCVCERCVHTHHFGKQLEHSDYTHYRWINAIVVRMRAFEPAAHQ